MNPIKCLLVDDEPPAIQLLQKYISMTEQLEIVGICHNAVRAFDMLREKPVDLMFLDIRMPHLNGIDFLKTLHQPPAVILTTAYREYAIDGYDLDIIDYLLKPIRFDRFLKAVDRYRSRNVPSIPAQNSPKKTSKTVFFNINKTQHKIEIDDILYLESLKDYVRIHTVKEALVVKGNLGTILKALPAELFYRIHRSFAVAASKVKSFNQSEVRVGDVKLPIGVSYRKDFGEKFRLR